MPAFELGLVLEPLGLPVKAALERAASLGARSVQFDAQGELRPDNLGTTARRELRTKLRSQNLELAAVQVPLRRGLDERDDQQARIDHILKAMAFAYDLGATVVAVPLPKLPADSETARAATLKESLLALGPHSDRIGVRLALEAGLDDGDKVRDYLQQFDCGLAITFDPANFLCNNHDPLAAFSGLGERVVHMQARDARAGSLSGGPKEVAVGAGDIDWIPLMAMLDALGYRGAIVVDREDGRQRALDVANGLTFLRRFAGPPQIAGSR